MSDLFDGNGPRGSYLIAPGLRMRDLYKIIYDRVDYIRPAVQTKTDIDALCQRACCEVEKKLGIYPNTDGVDRPAPADGWRAPPPTAGAAQDGSAVTEAQIEIMCRANCVYDKRPPDATGDFFDAGMPRDQPAWMFHIPRMKAILAALRAAETKEPGR